jgi:hypothetical protein
MSVMTTRKYLLLYNGIPETTRKYLLLYNDIPETTRKYLLNGHYYAIVE